MGAGFGAIVTLLFIVAMAVLVAGLGLFLLEIRLARRATRVRNELLERS